ncbi:MAG: hypothetical protein ACM3VW_00985 [Bacteroidota bacterium]
MSKHFLLQVGVVVVGSLLSFASPAAATYVGAEAAGVIGGVIGWIASALFVLAVVFPAMGSYVDRFKARVEEY